MTADELIKIVKKGFSGLKDPNDIFRWHEEFENMEEEEQIKFRNNRNSEALGMMYITAVEMKKEGTWENFVEERKKQKIKTAEEIKQELLQTLERERENKKLENCLIKELDKSIDSMENGSTMPHDKAMQMIREKLKDQC